MTMLQAKRLWIVTALLAVGVAPMAGRADHGDDGDDGDDWPMYNHDPRGSRHNEGESTLGTANVGGLHVKWQFITPAPVDSTPAVSNGMVFAGDNSGRVYALSVDGNLLWTGRAFAPITASVLVHGDVVIVGDIGGFLYGFDRVSGNRLWVLRPLPHPQNAIWGSPTPIGKNIAVGIASNEEFATRDPSYVCCSSRGGMALIEPKSGLIIWVTPTISDADMARGASGAGIWSTPSYDASTKTIYATTGNNYTEPVTPMAEAVIAYDATTGAVRWSNQLTPNDVWNFRFPFSPGHIDADFGDSAQIYHLPGGRKVVGAGQKSGFYHVLDAATGALLSQIQVEPSGILGGLFADTAIADGVVYANGINWQTYPLGAPVAGDLVAISGDASRELWRFTTPGSPDVSGVAVANGVVYFTSFNSKLYALSAATGAVLAQVPVGFTSSGPSVAGGTVYIGTGNTFLSFTNPGSITALGL
jgi:polyvinyl alcohol dehydrogenase (cytochrome)